MIGRGKNLSTDLRLSIEHLIKVVYDQHGTALIEQAPTSKLSKILEIVHREKKLEEIALAKLRAEEQAKKKALKEEE